MWPRSHSGSHADRMWPHVVSTTSECGLSHRCVHRWTQSCPLVNGPLRTDGRTKSERVPFQKVSALWWSSSGSSVLCSWTKSEYWTGHTGVGRHSGPRQLLSKEQQSLIPDPNLTFRMSGEPHVTPPPPQRSCRQLTQSWWSVHRSFNLFCCLEMEIGKQISVAHKKCIVQVSAPLKNITTFQIYGH